MPKSGRISKKSTREKSWNDSNNWGPSFFRETPASDMHASDGLGDEQEEVLATVGNYVTTKSGNPP